MHRAWAELPVFAVPPKAVGGLCGMFAHSVLKAATIL